MGEIAADANTFAKGVKGGSVRPSLLVVKLDMAVDKIAHGLNACPPSRYSSKRFPGEIEELAVDLTVPARQ